MISARLLSHEWRRRLVASAHAELSCTVHHPRDDPWPAGAVGYEARFMVSWDTTTAAEADIVDARLLSELAREQEPDEIGYVNVEVGQAVFLVGDFLTPTLGEALDARSEELLHVASTLLDSEHLELAPDLLQQIESGLGSGLLLVDDVSDCRQVIWPRVASPALAPPRRVALCQFLRAA